MSRAQAQAVLDRAAKRLLDEKLATEALRLTDDPDGSQGAGTYYFIKNPACPRPAETLVTDLACPDCGSECLERPDGSWECVVCGVVF